MSPQFEKVTLIGLGLIGSSLAWAMKRGGLAGHIAGAARSAETRAKSLELGFVDSVSDDMAEAVKDADLVVICTPLSAYTAVARAIAPHLKDGAIVSDVGSCKRSAIDDVQQYLPDHAHFVAAHPIAGTENSGPEAGFAELFDGRYLIITPTSGTDGKALERVKRLWETIGAIVEIMSPEHHDRVFAITSHLPHLIAYTIVGTVADLEHQLAREHVTDEALVRTNEVVRFSGSGFRDFTRIAGSDPTMWRDVFLKNREATLEMLGRFTEDLVALQRAIRWGEGEKLHDWFTRTREVRRKVLTEPARAPQVDWKENQKTSSDSD
ncbi:prephenate/arogenate dehydrogenase family protein [Aestuariispira ectoiniformans]|uniref:prephenate/arogenate dehydrogenase family protein n=1 Tax=Aestuariispira ectoiniformans TaxID=2775080 RepID=UPI00223AB05F|nr:prephenate/arogenate dehydrogenase family protein [Aestuariispira ectoiniformans]